jgi:hypothetical protein
MTDNAKSKSPLVIRAQHTPGPWEISTQPNGDKAFGVHTHGISGKRIIIVKWGGLGSPASIEGQANARLIAAAPEMLALLQDIHEHGYVTMHDFDRVRDCIAAATGARITSGDEQRDEAAMVHEPFPRGSHFGG